MTREDAENSLTLHARQAVALLPAEWPKPFLHSSPKHIRELAEQGDWRQVIYSIDNAGRSNPLSGDLASHVREARLAVSIIECLTTQYAIDRLTEVETKIVGECLNAAAHGPFFPDWEFHTLFGLTRQRIADIAHRWPAVDTNADDVGKAVNNSFNMLLGYPHKKWNAWSEFVSMPPQQATKVYERWRELTARRLSKNQGARRHFDYFE